MKIIKDNTNDFDFDGRALTLYPSDIGTHASGWTIEGEVHEDYYKWVNDFKASHPKYGRVEGNFEAIIMADTEEGYEHFYKHHTPDA